MPKLRVLHISDLHLAEVPDRIGLDLVNSEFADAVRGGLDVRNLNLTNATALINTASAYKRGLSQDNWLETARRVISPCSYDADAFLRLLHFARSNPFKLEYDFVALTGDLAASGVEDDLHAAQDMIGAGSSPNVWKEGSNAQLIDFTVPIIAVPGNHDRFQDFFGRPNGSLFDHYFSNIWKAKGARVFKTTKNFGKNRVSIISADFCLRRPKDADLNWSKLAVYGQGLAHRQLRDELHSLTKSCRGESRHPIIWLLHFPPFEVDQHLLLRDWDWLHLIMSECEVDLVLCGHLHEQIARRYNKTFVHVAASPCVVGATWRAIHYLICQIKDGRITEVEIENFEWRNSPDDFAEYGFQRQPGPGFKLVDFSREKSDRS